MEDRQLVANPTTNGAVLAGLFVPVLRGMMQQREFNRESTLGLTLSTAWQRRERCPEEVIQQAVMRELGLRYGAEVAKVAPFGASGPFLAVMFEGRTIGAINRDPIDILVPFCGMTDGQRETLRVLREGVGRMLEGVRQRSETHLLWAVEKFAGRGLATGCGWAGEQLILLHEVLYGNIRLCVRLADEMGREAETAAQRLGFGR